MEPKDIRESNPCFLHGKQVCHHNIYIPCIPMAWSYSSIPACGLVEGTPTSDYASGASPETRPL